MTTVLTPPKIQFLRQMLEKTRDVPGDVIEAGVFKGGSLLIISADIFPTGKHVWGYDTFEGLPELGLLDNKEAHCKGDFSHTSRDEVRKYLSDFPLTEIVQGYFPKCAAQNHTRISFAHLDMDLYEPTKQALVFLYGKMALDGIIVLDDYKFRNCPGVEKAVSEVMEYYEIFEESPYQVALKKRK